MDHFRIPKKTPTGNKEVKDPPRGERHASSTSQAHGSTKATKEVSQEVRDLPRGERLASSTSQAPGSTKTSRKDNNEFRDLPRGERLASSTSQAPGSLTSPRSAKKDSEDLPPGEERASAYNSKHTMAPWSKPQAESGDPEQCPGWLLSKVIIVKKHPGMRFNRGPVLVRGKSRPRQSNIAPGHHRRRPEEGRGASKSPSSPPEAKKDDNVVQTTDPVIRQDNEAEIQTDHQKVCSVASGKLAERKEGSARSSQTYTNKW